MNTTENFTGRYLASFPGKGGVSLGVSAMIDLHAVGYVLLALPALYGGDKLGTRLCLAHGDALYRHITLVAQAVLGLATTLRGTL